MRGVGQLHIIVYREIMKGVCDVNRYGSDGRCFFAGLMGVLALLVGGSVADEPDTGLDAASMLPPSSVFGTLSTGYRSPVAKPQGMIRSLDVATGDAGWPRCADRASVGHFASSAYTDPDIYPGPMGLQCVALVQCFDTEDEARKEFSRLRALAEKQVDPDRSSDARRVSGPAPNALADMAGYAYKSTEWVQDDAWPEILDRKNEFGIPWYSSRPLYFAYRLWIVRSGPTVAVFECSGTGFDAAPMAGPTRYPTGVPRAVTRIADAMLDHFVSVLPKGLVVEWSTSHAPLIPGHETFGDPWVFAQAEDIELSGRLMVSGRPLVGHGFKLSLESPRKIGYQGAQLTSDSDGTFRWVSFFAPHATPGTWTVILKGKYRNELWYSRKKIRVVEDPRLTAQQLRENMAYLQNDWKQATPNGPTYHVKLQIKNIKGMGSADLSETVKAIAVSRAQALIGTYPAGKRGPLNNNLATLRGAPYTHFTCGKYAERTLNGFNRMRYSRQYSDRKRMLGIGYMPVQNWPQGSSWNEYWHAHIAVLLFYDGYEHLKMSSPITVKQLAPGEPGIRPADASAVVLEPWLDQTPVIWKPSAWIKTFGNNKGMAVPGPDDSWCNFAPVPPKGGDYASYWYYVQETPAAKYRFAPGIVVLTLSPVRVMARNGDGRRVGYDPRGAAVVEVPGGAVETMALEDGVHQQLLLPQGDYSLEFEGTASGRFGAVICDVREGIRHYPATDIARGMRATTELRGGPAPLTLSDGRIVKPQTIEVVEHARVSDFQLNPPDDVQLKVLDAWMDAPDNWAETFSTQKAVARPYWADPKPVQSHKLHSYFPVSAVAWLADGKGFISADTKQSVRVWSFPDVKPIRKVEGVYSGKKCLLMLPKGKGLIIGESTGRVRCYTPDGSRQVWDYGVGVPVVSLSCDARGDTLCAAADNGDLVVLNTARGEVLTESSLRSFKPLQDAALRPTDADFLVTCAHRSDVLVSDLARNRLKKPLPLDSLPTAVSFNAEGTQFAVGTQSGGVHIFDADSRNRVAKLQGHRVNPRLVKALVFVDANTLISACAGGELMVWDLATRSLSATGQVPVKRGITDLALSPDGHALLTGGHDGTVTVWKGIHDGR